MAKASQNAVSTNAHVTAPYKKFAGKEVAADSGQRDGITRGLTTGLKITQFADELLIANAPKEAGGKGLGLADDVMQQALAAEFPGRKTIQSIAAYRNYFNAALHGQGFNGMKSPSVQKLTAASKVNVRTIPRGTKEEQAARKQAKEAAAAQAKADKAAAAQPAPAAAPAPVKAAKPRKSAKAAK